jgi:hypothetical protein
LSTRLEDDQRAGYCRHCGERLPLIKRVKREEFCSEEHRADYLNSTKDVALDRLREAGTEALQHALGGAWDEQPPPAATVAAVMEPVSAPAAPEPEPTFAAGSLAASFNDNSAGEPVPPLAGSIAPLAVRRPLRLAIVLDGDSGMASPWEPILPEPEWSHLALRFGLAEFSECAPAVAQTRSMTMAAASDGPADVIPSMAMPQNNNTVIPPMAGEGGSADPGHSGALMEPPLAGPVEPGPVSASEAMFRPLVPVAEPVELDVTLYLSGFSPSAERGELAGAATWGEWKSVALAVPAPQAGIPRLAAVEAEAMELVPTGVRLPLESGCVAEAAVEPATPEMKFEAELESQASGTPFDEHFFAPDEQTLVEAPMGEERGMSQAVQTTAPAGLAQLGERLALPFTHEPRPRAGAGQPRWAPVTAAMNTSVEAATEDWDIL